MAGQHHGGAGTGAAPFTDHVADAVHAHAGEPEALEGGLVGDSALGLLEGRRGDLAHRHLLVESPGVVALELVEHRFHVGALGELRGGLGCGGGERGGNEQADEGTAEREGHALGRRG